MPQLRVFKRRWRIASDTFPVLAAFLAIVHFAFVAPMLSVAANTESADYTCNKKVRVQVALFGMLVLYTISAFNESAMVVVGLRGGPLEERKRRALRYLIYLEVFLWVLILGFTSVATYVGASPEISATCWSNNPCAYISNVVPSACTADKTGDIVLTDSCAQITENADYFSVNCFDPWFNYASTWAVHHYNVSHQPQPFNPPANKTAVCDSSIALDSKYFIDWADAHIPPDQAFTFTEDDIARITRLSSTIESAFLKFLGINHTFETAGEDAPWFHCFDPLCQQLINAGDDCEDWDVLLNIPDSTDRKVAYLAAVYTSWFLIFITALIVFFAFNAFPNYDSSESWERTVRSLSQLCCCSNVLDVAETEMGDSASKEIGNMLHMLFGGIDLDPTDQVLGMYLVAERQRWRQRKHVIAKLKAAGIKPQPKPPTLFRKLFGRCLPARKGSYSRKLSQTASQVVLSSEMTSVTAPGGQAGMEALVRKPEPSPAAAKAVSGGSIAPSPFANSGSFESSGSRRLRPTRSIEYRPPSIAQSFVRLVSVKISRDSTGAPSASVVANNGDAVLEDGLSSPLSETMSVAAVEKALVVDDRHQPLLTPVNLRKVGIRVPLTSFEAAEIYIGQKSRAVPQVLLEEALQMSRFAKAAYGLQTVRWKAATTGSIVTDTLDRFLACCSPLSKPLGLENRFRKRNYNAILDITGACPEDLLYVSYTTAAFGVLPYMLLLHRPTRSVVLSVRGTVGFENLITDLLSNPVDASDAMPDWVLEATGHSRKSTGGEEVNDPESGQLFAHSGILSSTNSVLRDLEAKGLLDSMKDIHSGAQELAGSPCAETGANRADPHPHLHSNADMLENINKLEADDEVNLSLERARSAVNEAVVGQGWRIVVTGHSLGAAVACMLSFHLKEHFPSLQCFALCPPGGLMSAPLCRLSRQFCTSVVVGADAISRLAIPTTQRTVDDMVLALARCKRPKLAVFMDALLGRRKDPATAPPTFCAFEDVGPEALAALRKYVATSKLHSAGLDDRQLFPPGRIIHLRAFAASGKKKGPEAEVWDAVWVGAQDVIGEGLLLSMDMMRHHRVPTLQYALSSAIKGEAMVLPEQKATLPGTGAAEGRDAPLPVTDL